MRSWNQLLQLLDYCNIWIIFDKEAEMRCWLNAARLVMRTRGGATGPWADLRRAALGISLCLVVAMNGSSAQAVGPRARDLGIPFDGTPGPLNAITDVPGLEVGQSTLITKGPEYGARTGVTVIFPLGKNVREGVAAGSFAFNGTGELTGKTYMEETGRIFGPISLTGTLSLSTVYRGVLEWTRDHFPDQEDRYRRHLPMVGETYDGYLNQEEFSFPLTTRDVTTALDGARSGPVDEGNTGGGTGMRTFGFSGGTGTSSRRFEALGTTYTLGVIVQSNHSPTKDLRVSGVPVGKALSSSGGPHAELVTDMADGSIIIVVATDAPLLPDQLKRVARHATVGLALTGGGKGTGSGDIFVAVSTANRVPVTGTAVTTYRSIPNDQMSEIFDATAQATEEAIINAIVSGRTLSDSRGHFIPGLPIARVVDILQRANRLDPASSSVRPRRSKPH